MSDITAGSGTPGIGLVFDNIIRSGRNPVSVLSGFAAAWLLFFAVLLLLPTPPGLSAEGQAVLAIVVWASIMWVTEAMPVGITGLSIPTLLIVTRALPWPIEAGKASPPMEQAFSGFTNGAVWLCLFAFMVGGMMKLLKLDRRIAMTILDWTRASTVGRVIAGMFAVNVVLAFLVPAANARAAAMLPVVTGIANMLGDSPRERDCQKAIVIQSLVYGSMICGMFILTAHLPNLILVNLFASHGLHINYLQWMLLQFPYLGMFVITQWWVRWFFRTGGINIAGGPARVREQRRSLGPMSSSERALIAVFGCMALLFFLSDGSPIFELHHLALGVIGLIGIMVLFTPGLFPFTWKQVEANTIWGTFLLLGGALTMTSAMASSGLAGWLAANLHAVVSGLGWWLALLVVILGSQVIRLGMLSNVAAVAMLAPITWQLGQAMHLNAVAFTTLVCDSDSFSYILPTQITAAVIAYGSEKFTTLDYAKVGLGSTLIGIAYVVLVMVPWYAFLGLPVWNAAAPWPF
jgi:solute carrier family 13 (sodium-dependent dicarboxylate transporter), member 2/3/5